MNFAASTIAKADTLQPSPRPSPSWRVGPSKKAWMSAAIGVLVAAINAVMNWPAAFAGWNFYDDEGAMLVMFRSFAERGGLYSRTYSNYGPFPFAFWWSVLRPFGFAYDNLFVGRLLALVLLVASSWITFHALRAQSTLAWSVIGAFAVGSTLTLNFSEPFHPGALIGLLLAVGFWAQTRLQTPKARLAVEGFVCAALSLTKINLGAFFLVAWLATGLLQDRQCSAGARRIIVIVLASMFPLLTIVPSTNDVATMLLAVSVSVAVALVCFGATCGIGGTAARRSFVRTLPMFLIGAAPVVIFAFGVTLARGSTLRDVLDGVLFRAIRQRGVFFAPPLFDSPRLAVFLAAIGLSGFSVWSIRRNRMTRTDRLLVSLVSVLGGLGLVAAPTYRIALLPLLALLVVRPQEDRETAFTPTTSSHSLLFAVLFAILQVLHAYPVAQSQVAWATMLLPLCGVLLLGAGMAGVRSVEFSETRKWASATRLAVGVAAVSFVTLVARPMMDISPRWATYRSLTPMSSRHAAFVRIEDDQARILQGVSAALEANCSAYYSLPGMYTFNALTDLPIATGYNATVWTSLFTERDQAQVLKELRTQERLCIVRNDFVLRFWTQDPLPKSRLLDYISTFDQQVTSIGGYSISARRSNSRNQQ